MTIIHKGIKLLVRCCKGNQNSGVFPQILEKVLPPLDKGVYAVVYLPHNSHRTVHSAQVIDIRTELTASRLRIVILVFQQPFNLFINNESHPPRGCGGKAHGTTGLHLLHRPEGDMATTDRPTTNETVRYGTYDGRTDLRTTYVRVDYVRRTYASPTVRPVRPDPDRR